MQIQASSLPARVLRSSRGRPGNPVYENRGEAAAADSPSAEPALPRVLDQFTFRSRCVQRLLIVNLLRLTPSSTPVPRPVSDSEPSPLVRACASDDGPAPAAAPALA